MVKNFLLITLLSAFLFSCHKKDKSPCVTTPIQIAYKLNPYLFGAGSYWVYKDSTTGIIDSLRLFQASIYNRISPGGPSDACPEEIQSYSCKIYNFETKEEIIYEVERGFIWQNNVRIYTASTSYDPFCPLVNTFSTLMIENEMYNNVKEFSISNGNGYINYYFADYVGLIKKTENNNGIITNSNLLRHSVVMY